MSPGAAAGEAIGEPERAGHLSTGEAGGFGCLPVVAVGCELAAGRSLRLETASAAAAAAAAGGGDAEADAAAVTGAQNDGEPSCP